jgi:hypothetical protein
MTKTEVISYVWMTNIVFYEYQLHQPNLTKQLYFHNHVDFLFFERIKLLGLTRSINFRFSKNSKNSLLHLIFSPEDGGEIFLLNIG